MVTRKRVLLMLCKFNLVTELTGRRLTDVFHRPTISIKEKKAVDSQK